MSTLWSGRFDQAPDAAAFEWGSSFSFDRRLFEDDVTGSIAWARALEGAGVLTADESTSIQRVLAAILEKGRANPAFVDGADEDVLVVDQRAARNTVGGLHGAQREMARTFVLGRPADQRFPGLLALAAVGVDHEDDH